MTQNLFCFGLGYCAEALIAQLKGQEDGWSFSGSSRRLRGGSPPPVIRHIFDGTRPLIMAEEILANVTHLLISIPPQDNMIDPVLQHHRDIISRLTNLKWVGYLSTTGIYGDRGGDWVDEETKPAPTSVKGQARLEAEMAWLTLFKDHNIPVHIFRLGSIYGPNKGQLVNLQAGRLKKIIKEGQFFSRIHVNDITQSLMASIASPHGGQVYNLVDDMPAPSADVIDYICDLLGHAPLPAINFDDAEMSLMMKIFYSENKRVRNDRIKKDLGITLKYPTYKHGFLSLTKDLKR